jgi:hypothetical protein
MTEYAGWYASLSRNMTGDQWQREHARRSTHSDVEWVILDRDGSLADDALDLRVRLAELAEERRCAREAGLGDDYAYCEDLELEFAETSFIHEAAVVLQLVRLRAELDGPRRG